MSTLLVLHPFDLSRVDAWLLEWLGLIAVAGLASVTVWRGTQFGLDLPLGLACAFLYGPLLGGFVAFLAAFEPRELRRETSLANALFNRAQVGLSVMAAGTVFSTLGGSQAQWPEIAVPGLLGVGTDILINSSFYIAATMLKSGLGWTQVLSRMRFGSTAESVAVYLCFGFLSLPLMDLFEVSGGWGLAGFVVPLFLAREALAHGREALELDSHLRSTRSSLANVSERIAAERQDERARIASALHDDVLQALYNVTLHAQVVREDLRWGQLLALEADVPHLQVATEQARSLLRDVIRDLRRSPLGRKGVTHTLGLLVRQLEEETEAHIEADLECIEPPPSLQLVIYQVAREALVNAVRHAKSSHVKVLLRLEGNEIRLVVEDDGGGFDPQNVDEQDHFGLALMRERVEMANGVLSIHSSRDGTILSARFHLEHS